LTNRILGVSEQRVAPHEHFPLHLRHFGHQATRGRIGRIEPRGGLGRQSPLVFVQAGEQFGSRVFARVRAAEFRHRRPQSLKIGLQLRQHRSLHAQVETAAVVARCVFLLEPR